MNKLYTIKSIILILLCILAILTCSGCSSLRYLFPTIEERSANAGRPPEATQWPEFTDEITDIRLSVVERDIEFDPDRSSPFKNQTHLQIFYGYQMNGEWYDIPSENYELKGILQYEGLSGYDAACNDHLVQIGHYVLMCFVYEGAREDVVYHLSDSSGTEIQEPFAEYYTNYFHDTNEPSYGFFREKLDPAYPDKALDLQALNIFGRRYYLLLDLNSLPDDYELHISAHPESDSSEIIDEWVLYADDIQRVLGQG